MLTVSPTSISNTYPGSVTLQISGLTNGETVQIERFLDANGNGTNDVGELLVQSFKVTDGVVTAFGGVRDANIPGDEDGVADGQISTAFYFSASPEFGRVAGNYVFRLSSPTDRFAPVVQSLTVTRSAFSQFITGQITNGGTNVPYASVALLVQTGQDVEFVAGAAGDASGNFAITAAPGTYLVLAARPGFVSDLSTAPVITLNPGEAITQNLTLTQPTTVIAGKVSDVVSSNGIPGLQLFFESANNTITFAFTDTNGNFNADVLKDKWKIDISDASLRQTGYLRPQNKPQIDTTAFGVIGVNIPLTRETALIYGFLKNDTYAPLPGISLSGNDNNNLYQANATTDASGNYTMGVTAGAWFIGPDNQNPGLAGYIVQGTNVTLTNGQALQVNFVAQRSTAHLLGRVTDTGGSPITGLTILAFPQNGGSSVSATTDSNGNFDLGVFGGSWTVQLESGSAAQHNVIGPTLQFNVTDGVNISNINYVAQSVTAQINGFVRNSQAAGLANVFVYASATMNGTNYNQNAQTDGTGHYQFGVFNGTWQLSVGCSDLNNLGYGCPNQQTVVVSGANQTVNFTAQPFSNTPPRLTQPQLFPGQFQFQLSGESGRNYRIDTTADFATWATLGTNSAFGGSFSFIDTNAPGFRKRFYRAVLVP